MKDDLRQRLKSFPPLQPSEKAKERALHRSLIAFQQGGRNVPEYPRRSIWIRRGLIAFSFLLILTFFHSFFPKVSSPVENLAKDRETLLQMEKLFPGQVNAVVEENGTVEVSVAQDSVIGSDQPILIVFNRGDKWIRVLSYSGQRICLNLNNRMTCLEVLATPSGTVVLSSGEQAWLSSQSPVIAGYTVKARTLEVSL